MKKYFIKNYIKSDYATWIMRHGFGGWGRRYTYL